MGLRARRSLWLLGAVVIGVALAALAFGTLRAANHPQAGLVGRSAPDFVLRRLDGGGEVRLASLRGKPVVVNFWASWCVPCRQEAPLLNAAAKAYSGRVQFLGVDIQDSETAARSFVREEHVPYPTGSLVSGSYRDFEVTAPPETYFIDLKGRVAARVVGPLTRTELALRISEVANFVVTP